MQGIYNKIFMIRLIRGEDPNILKAIIALNTNPRIVTTMSAFIIKAMILVLESKCDIKVTIQ